MIPALTSRIYFVACLAIFVFCTGCIEPETAATVVIDNGQGQTITVFVDGEKMRHVKAGFQESIRVPFGEHDFVVKTADDEVTYQDTHQVEPGKSSFVRPCYIFNPDQQMRYCHVQVDYGDNSRAEAFGTSMTSMIAWAASQNDPNLSDADRKIAAEKDRLRSAYRTLLNDAKPMESTAFFRAPSADRILKPVPSVVFTGRHSQSKTMTTLMRVPQKLHSYLEAAKEDTDITIEDVQTLSTACDLIQTLVPTT
jgi:hypothetical protein